MCQGVGWQIARDGVAPVPGVGWRVCRWQNATLWHPCQGGGGTHAREGGGTGATRIIS